MRAWPIVLVFLALAGCHKKKLDPAVATGRELYLRMCAVCHGDAGEGRVVDSKGVVAQVERERDRIGT